MFSSNEETKGRKSPIHERAKLKDKKIKKKKEMTKDEIKKLKKRERLQKEREKWKKVEIGTVNLFQVSVKEKAEFQKRDEETARRKKEQNAYKKKESGTDYYEESLRPAEFNHVEDNEEKSLAAKVINEEIKIEDEATIRLLLCTTKEEYDWQSAVAKKYRQFEKHGAKIKIDDAETIFTAVQQNSKITFSELVFELKGTPKILSMTVKDIVDRFTQERYKKMGKVKGQNYRNNEN